MNETDTQTAAQQKVDDLIYRIEMLPKKQTTTQLKLDFEKSPPLKEN